MLSPVLKHAIASSYLSSLIKPTPFWKNAELNVSLSGGGWGEVVVGGGDQVVGEVGGR